MKTSTGEKLLNELELSARNRLHHLMTVYQKSSSLNDRDQLRVRIDVLNDLIAVMSGVGIVPVKDK